MEYRDFYEPVLYDLIGVVVLPGVGVAHTTLCFFGWKKVFPYLARRYAFVLDSALVALRTWKPLKRLVGVQLEFIKDWLSCLDLLLRPPLFFCLSLGFYILIFILYLFISFSPAYLFTFSFFVCLVPPFFFSLFLTFIRYELTSLTIC